MDRRTFLKGMAAVGTLPVIAGCASTAASSSKKASVATADSTSDKTYSLVFDKSDYTVKSKSVSTGSGTKTVKYHFWEGIVYVAHPVSTKYQSLNVALPVEIDGKAVDATNAPILLENAIGGYMSSSVSGGAGGGGGGPTSGSMSASGAPGGSSKKMTGKMPSGSAPSGSGGPGGSSAKGGSSSTSKGAPEGSSEMVGTTGQQVDNGDLALAAGYVVVYPGARGRDCETSSGKYYGKAPAGIVDLKAAVRYVRYNAGRIPGNTDWIISSGTSAGGAYSALLGASGGSDLYDGYLDALGAADASDRIFASADYCPITDLNHADMQYEWMLGTIPVEGGKVVNQTISKELKAEFPAYLAELDMTVDGIGTLTADNYSDYLREKFLEPAATTYLKDLSATKRAAYLKEQDWITWSDEKATFDWAHFLTHVGRMKGEPAFDSFTLSNPENIEFGDTTTNARHFTLFSLRHATGNQHAELASDLPEKIKLMNPMYFIQEKNSKRCKNWWIRVGTSDTNTSLSIAGSLSASLKNLGDNVNTLMYWDAGHGANEDAPEFIKWIAKITGYTS